MYRAARARALGQQAAAPGPFSKPGGGDAQLSLSQTSAAPDFYFPSMGDPLASQELSHQSTSSGNGSSRVGSKRTSPLKDAATGDLVMGGLLAGAGIAMPPELMDETSRPPDTSAATARAIFTPVVMNQHGACVSSCPISGVLYSDLRHIKTCRGVQLGRHPGARQEVGRQAQPRLGRTRRALQRAAHERGYASTHLQWESTASWASPLT